LNAVHNNGDHWAQAVFTAGVEGCWEAAMATLYMLKPGFQALLRPLVVRVAAAGVSANQLTVTAAAGSLAVGAITAANARHAWLFLLLAVWFLLRMALNVMDGMLAREFAHQSRLGAYLNEIGDLASDAALYAPFAFVAPFAPLGVWLVIVLSGITEIAGVLGQALGATRRYDGPMGKSDRTLVFGALGLLIGSGFALPAWFAWLMPLLALLLVITIVRRVRAGLTEHAGKIAASPKS
jgi:CDP-diacylglycerol--glycerol-3-phosphate 3-phosphatidyltransferase